MIISGQSTVIFDSLCSGPRSRTHLNQKNKKIYWLCKQCCQIWLLIANLATFHSKFWQKYCFGYFYFLLLFWLLLRIKNILVIFENRPLKLIFLTFYGNLILAWLKYHNMIKTFQERWKCLHYFSSMKYQIQIEHFWSRLHGSNVFGSKFDFLEN